jgi:fucose permease
VAPLSQLTLRSINLFRKFFKKAFGISKSKVVLTSSLFLLGNVSASLFVYPITKKIGLTLTIILSFFILTLGCGLRVLGNEDFSFILIGQILCGIAACFVVNTILQFCFNWFHPINRPIYLSIISIMNVFGGGMGNTIPILFVDETENDEGVIKNQLFEYNLKIAIFAGIVFVINIFFFRGKPPQGFGYLNKEEEEELEEVKGENFFVETFKMIKYLMSFKIFRSYLWLYNLTNTSIVCLGSLINIIIGMFGYSSVF